MGLGNTYYLLAKSDDAEKAYRKAIALDPEHAPARNNLAQVLLERNQLNEAEHHARRAVQLGGAHASTYKQTLEQIRKKAKQRQVE